MHNLLRVQVCQAFRDAIDPLQPLVKRVAGSNRRLSHDTITRLPNLRTNALQKAWRLYNSDSGGSQKPPFFHYQHALPVTILVDGVLRVRVTKMTFKLLEKRLCMWILQ